MGLDRDTLTQLRGLLRPLANRIANTVARGVVHLADDAKKLRLLQLGALAGETIDGAEHFEPYGFSSVPLSGAEHVTIFPNGDRSHAITVAVSDRRYRPTGKQPGEVTVYNNAGASMTMTKDGDIIGEPAPGRQMLVRSAGGTAVALATKADLQALVTTFNAHTHAVATTGTSTAHTGTAAAVTSPAGVPAGTTVLKAE